MKKKLYDQEKLYKLARDGYENESADFPIIAKNAALLVIDMQEEFITPFSSINWLPEGTKIVPAVKELVEKCRERFIPVIYTAFVKTHHGLDRPKTLKFMPITFPKENIEISETSTHGNIVKELEPMPDEVVIYKPSYGAFYDTPLDTILKTLKKDTVIISGVLSNFCCGTTARQAYERSYNVVFGSDITATDVVEMHDAELKVLRRGFAKVMTGSEISDSLEISAEHAVFNS